MEITPSSNTLCAVEPEIIPTLSKKQAAPPGKEERCAAERRRVEVERMSTSGGGEEKDLDVEVERKIIALQKIVPGGETLVAENLFEETAEYILALQCQVKALRFLVAFVEGSEIKKRKLGG